MTLKDEDECIAFLSFIQIEFEIEGIINTWSYDDICHPCDVNHRPTPKSDQLLKIGFGWVAITAYIDATNVKEQLRPKTRQNISAII